MRRRNGTWKSYGRYRACLTGATRIAITATIDRSAFAPQAVVEIEAVPKTRWEDARIHDLRRVAQMYLGATAFLRRRAAP